MTSHNYKKPFISFLLAPLLLALAPMAMAAKAALLKMPVYVNTSLQGLGTTPKWLAEQVRQASGGSLAQR